MNKLYYGDCLTVMDKQMGLNEVDLIYLDPPFNSNRTYNAIYKDETGRPLPDQIEAFCDLWTLDQERERAIKALPEFMVEHGVDDSLVIFWKLWMNTLRDRDPKLLAYLSYMVERLVYMRIILKPRGSIYLHCDPTYSHYLKVVMDSIFGEKNFRNEIVWYYDGPQRPSKKNFGRKHDIILRYTKSDKFFANSDGIAPRRKLAEIELTEYKQTDDGRYYYDLPRGSYTDQSIERLDKEGRIRWTKNGKPRVIYFLDEDDKGNYYRSKQLHDVWTDIPSLGQVNAKEKLGYPTQKPLKLIKRIIRASSDEGHVVFDPFCGCGTTLEAAHLLKRQWIGVDIAIHAINRVSAIRLNDRCGLVEGKDYEITGIPNTMEGAEDLWRRDNYQFQKWAVEEVGGFVTARKSKDGGFDGRLYFPSDGANDLKAMKLEVKGGKNIRIESLRALAGVIDTEGYPIGGFITLKTLGPIQRQNFLDFCREKGEVEIGEKSYPRLQFLTVKEIFEGRRFNTPTVRGRSASDQLKFELS